MQTQDAINDAEWARAENWHRRGWVTWYSSTSDTRLYVPKKNPRYGWTINFAHPQSRWTLVGLFTVPIGFVILGILLGVGRLLHAR